MAKLNAFSYSLPCTSRALSYFPNKSREGLFVCVDNDDGPGVGEFAPLAAIHCTTIDEAIASHKSFKSADLSRALTDAKTVVVDDLGQYFSGFPPLIAYVLSMAYFHRSVAKQQINELATIKLAALIEISDAASAIRLAQHYVAQGYSHIKIKIGKLAIEEEINKIKSIAAIAHKNTKLRLDGNRRLSLADASTLMTALKKIPIEYFEEPTHECDRLPELWQRHGANLAIDESLTNVNDIGWLIENKVTHVIIKPARFNNLFTTFKLVNDLKALGLVPIFSHCFESEFSSAIFSLMIDMLGLHENAHGIFPEGFFRHGVFLQPLRSCRGQLRIAHARDLCVMPFLRANETFMRVI